MNVTTRQKNSILNLVTGFGGRFLVILLRFVTRTVFIYTLGKAYLGINGLFSDILTMLSLTELGIGTAMNYRLYKPIAENDERKVRIVMKFYRQAYMAIGAVIFLLGVCLIPFLPVLISDYSTLATLGIPAVLVFMLYLLKTVFSYLFLAYRSALIRANQKNYINEIIQMGASIVTITAQIIVLVVWQDFILYTVIDLFTEILQNLIASFVATRLYKYAFIKEKESLPKAEVTSLFKDCGALFLHRMNGVVLAATDSIVLSANLGLVSVGLYANYVLFKTAIVSLLERFYSACEASMGNLFATHDIETNYKFFELMNFVTIILYGTSCVGIGVVVNEVIEVWIGSDYLLSEVFAVCFGMTILCTGLKRNLSQICDVTGVFQQMWYRPLIGVVLNLVISVILVRSYGITGVVVGTIMADVLADFIIDPTVVHKYSFGGEKSVWRYYRRNLMYLLLLAGIEAADFWICHNVFTGHGLFSLVVHVIICAVSVPAIFAIIYWHSDECQYMIKTISAVLSKLNRNQAS